MLKLFLLLLAAFAAYILIEAGFFLYKYTHLPVLPAIDQRDKVLGQGPALRYIAAGDSTGVGYGASSVENTYTYKIAKFFSKNNTVYYKNISTVGFKTSDVLSSQVQKIIDYKPDVVTISIGPNDATHLVAGNRILDNYKSIIDKLEKGTSSKIYITDIANFDDATVLPWLYYRLLEYRSASLNPRIIELGDQRVKVINIHDFGWSKYNRKLTYAADHFHPNDLGYENWTNAFIDKIE